MITVVIENRITSEVKTGDANNKVVSKGAELCSATASKMDIETIGESILNK